MGRGCAKPSARDNPFSLLPVSADQVVHVMAGPRRRLDQSRHAHVPLMTAIRRSVVFVAMRAEMMAIRASGARLLTACELSSECLRLRQRNLRAAEDADLLSCATCITSLHKPYLTLEAPLPALGIEFRGLTSFKFDPVCI